MEWHDRRSKESKLERHEREAEREKRRRNELEYEARLKEWECRERKKEKERQHEIQMEKEREWKRRMKILDDEQEEEKDADDDSRKSALNERRKKMQREKEKKDDLADRKKEEEEIMVTEQDAVADYIPDDHIDDAIADLLNDINDLNSMASVAENKNKRVFDINELIDMIPKTKEELFSYQINWAVYDKNKLHERMRPWIANKIKVFLGEEENTFIDYIVSCTQKHVKPSDILELLEKIIDEEAEMFVFKMWRVLIFEIKKNKLHERMRPWIAKKIKVFLGEEENTFIDYIVSSTQNHVKPSDILEVLEKIIDEEAEMFVFKMWRVLIFEIKKVETGLALRFK